MAFCTNCGARIDDGVKFCPECGTPTNSDKQDIQRKQEYLGKIIKCPNCGEVLKSFASNCPSCGFEFREMKTASSVHEFAVKLEAIEARREYEKPRGIFSAVDALQRVSKTDEQKISLIQSFPVPNTKEDILEFMILATSNVNLRSYDSTNTNISKGEKALNDAWMSKIKQVYGKASNSYNADEDFLRIQKLYDGCTLDIKKSKKKGIYKWGLMFGWMPLLFIVLFSVIAIKAPGVAKKENERLEIVEQTAITALDNKEYKKALLNAKLLEYSPGVRNGDSDEIQSQWDVKRELLIDEILEAAKADGIKLEYVPIEDASETTQSSGGVIEGFKEGVEPGLEKAKENVDEFNRILNGEGSSETSNNKQ